MDFNIGGMATVVLNIALMVLSVVLVGGIIVGAWVWGKYLGKFRQFKCVIWERDGFGQLKESSDTAGVFVDNKTKNKRLFLKKNKVGLNPDTVPYLQCGKLKTIYLLKTGLKNFSFINVNVKEPTVSLSVGEEDVNWSINAYERQKKLFQSGLLMQLMPFIMIAFVSIIILILFVYLFKNFAAFTDAALALKEAAQSIAGARSGTVVISG